MSRSGKTGAGVTMSIRTMSKVWESSQHSGSNLLMLLAVADFSDDDGVAFPAVEKLARKCRMSKRNAQDRLRELSESGELTILKNQGPPPKYPNLFRVNLGALGVKPTAPVQPTSRVQSSVKRGEADCTPGVKPTAPKPSVNHQKPSTRSDDDVFAAFWEQYPKKVAKTQAMKAWQKLKPSKRLLSDLMAGLERAKSSANWQKDGGQFIPHPATWINGRRWEDESTASASSAAPSLPQPGAVRQRHGIAERFDEVAGWVPA
jgi:hypothetical protein